MLPEIRDIRLSVLSLLQQPLSCFIAQIFAIMLVSRVLGWLARNIGQPMVVAEITAGILLGPSLLGVVAPELSAALFSGDSLVLMQIVSQLGLVLFMFLIGLELDPKLLRGSGHAPLVMAQTTFLVPLGLGIVLALYLYPQGAASGVPRATFAIFVGATLSSTAFPVLARILSERRLVRSRVGTLAIACAAIDDVTAWCLLAFVVASVRAKGLVGAVATSVLAVVYLAAMFAVVRPLLRRLLSRVESGVLSHDRIAVVLLLLFLSSWATEIIGIHALIGAFTAGAIMPREGGTAHAIADRLGDTVIVVLLPLFFAYSGVRTEIGLLDSWTAWATCGVVVLVACVGKLGAGTLAARLAGGLSWRESTALGALMNTRGLMVLIVLNVGLDLGVIEPAFFSMMVVAALVTTFVTTPIVDAAYPLEQHVRDLLASPRPCATLPRPALARFTVLLCAEKRRSVRALSLLAEVFGTGRPDVSMYALAIRSPEDEVGNEADALEAAASSTSTVKRMSFPSDEPAREICGIAQVKRADWVLLHRPHGAQGGRLLGSTTTRVATDCDCGVGVLFGVLNQAPREVLALYGGHHEESAVDEIVERFRREGVRVAAVSYKQAPEALADTDFDLVLAGLPESYEAKMLPPALQSLGEHHGAMLLVRGPWARTTGVTR